MPRPFPIGVLIVALLLTLVMISGLTWFAWRSHEDFETLETKDLRMVQLHGTIQHFDELLSLTAQLAAATGEPAWKPMIVAEIAKVDAALDELAQISPGLIPEETVADLQSAKRSLQQQELQVLEHADAGDLKAAQAILSSSRYQADQERLAAAEVVLLEQIRAHLDQTLDSQHQRNRYWLVLVIIFLLLISFAWVYALRTIRNYFVEKQQAADDLQARTSQLEESQRVAQLGSWDWDIASDDVTWSDELYHIFGVERGNYPATYQSFLDMVHPKDRQMLVNAVENAIETRSHYHVDVRILRDDGSVWVMEALGDVICDDEGIPIRMGGTAQDITARKETEATILNIAAGVSAATGETFFGSLVEHLGSSLKADYAFIGELRDGEAHSVHTIVTMAHGKLSDNVEYSLPGTPCEDVIAGELCAYASDVQMLYPDDQLLVEMGVEGYIGAPLTDSEGNTLGIMVVLFEQPVENMALSGSLMRIFAVRASAEMERMRAEAARRESEERYRTLFEESRDAVFIASMEGKLLDVNPAGLEMLGYPEEELRELDLARDLYTDPQARDEYQRKLATAGYVTDYEIMLRCKDGSEKLFSISSNLTYDDNGNVAGNWGIGRDITEQRALEQQLIRSQKLESIGRLAGGVAHDFNNFLTAIKGYTDLTLLELPSDSTALENMYEVSKATERAIAVTRQLLYFSRRSQLDMKIIDMNALVTNMKRMLDRLIGERHEIMTDLADDLQSLIADPGHLEQVVVNLVVNARDAMPEGGSIRLRTENLSIDRAQAAAHPDARPGDFVCLSVSDQGSGIGENIIERIFEPFFSTKEVDQGTGLGLAVAYGITEQHGGWIDVDSEEGVGSTFKICLPVVPAEPEKVEEAETPMEEFRGSGERILVVEDEEGVRNLVNKMLSRSGFEVLVAADAREALAIFEREQGGVDLVFSDVVLPGENGVLLAERLLKAEPGLPVLLASGYHEDEYRKEIDARGYRFLQKPYSLPELMQSIKELLDHGN